MTTNLATPTREQSCTARLPSLGQDQLEAQVRGILEELFAPPRFTAMLDAAVTAYARDASPRRAASVKSLGVRLDRLKALFEMGDLTLEDYGAA